MRTRSQKYGSVHFSILIMGMLMAPLIASASWWNPFSWFGGWFGASGGQKTQETVSEEQPAEPSASTFFTRARPAKPVTPQPLPTPPALTAQPSRPNPTPIVPVPEPIVSPTPNPTSPVAQGTITFSGPIQVSRFTNGTATSSNTMRIAMPPGSTNAYIDVRSDRGIYFAVEQCLTNPCVVKNVASVPSTVPEGTYPINVNVTSGSFSAKGTFSLIVLPPEPSRVEMKISGGISMKKNSGGYTSGSNSITVQQTGGSPELITFTQSKFPDGITGNTNLGSCFSPCTIYNYITASYTAVPGQYSMVIHAKGKTIDSSVGYTIFVGSSDTFGMNFKGEERTFTQNENPTAKIVMDYPFDLLLDGGNPETATLSFYAPNASTTVTYSRQTCQLPCMGMNARIEILPGMKQGIYSLALTANVDRVEEGYGGARTVRYSRSWYIPIKIVPLTPP